MTAGGLAAHLDFCALPLFGVLDSGSGILCTQVTNLQAPEKRGRVYESGYGARCGRSLGLQVCKDVVVPLYKGTNI